MEKKGLLGVFASNMRERRRKMGLTQSALAARLGVSASFVTEIETCRKAPSFATIEKLADVMQAPVWTFFCLGGHTVDSEDARDEQLLRWRLENNLKEALDKTFGTSAEA